MAANAGSGGQTVDREDGTILPDVSTDAVEQARRLPKVELHAHLDCGLSYEVVHRLDPNVSEATFRREFIAPGKCTDLRDYLRYPPREVALMQTAEQLRLVTLDAIEQLRRDGVVYAELRFAPYQHVLGGLSLEQIVTAVDDAVVEGQARTGVEVRLILCTLRHFSTEQGLATATVATRFAATPGSAVVAIVSGGGRGELPHRAARPSLRLCRRARTLADSARGRGERSGERARDAGGAASDAHRARRALDRG